MAHPQLFTDMHPRSSPPLVAVRVIDGFVWEHFIERNLHLSRTAGAPLPRLGPPGDPAIYITDPQSMTVCTTAEDYAMRLSFPSTPSPIFTFLNQPIPLHQDPLRLIRAYGCAIVYFVPPSVLIETPPPTAVNGRMPSSPGLTVGGAREWLLHANPTLDLLAMEVFFVTPTGRRWGPIRQ